MLFLILRIKRTLKTSSLSEDMLTVDVGVAEDTVGEDEGTEYAEEEMEEKKASGSVDVEEDIVHSIVGEWVYQKNISGGLTSSAKAAQHSRSLR